MPVELPEGISACPHCTYPTIHSGPVEMVTMGCGQCNYTGRKNFWKVVGEKRGGRYHFRIWIGPWLSNGALISNGIMREEDWRDLCLQMDGNPLWKITEIKN
jgi:hypothetical protein